MSAITANGAAVAIATITIPHYGTWTADLVLPVDAAITSPVVLVVGDLTLTGAVVRQGPYNGDLMARVVGGAGGWRRSLPSRGYSHAAGVKASSVLADVARESGETIVVSADRVLGQHWARDAGKAEKTLRAVLGGLWWVDSQGVTQTAARASATIVAPFTVVSWSPATGQFEIATETLTPWLPGNTFSSPTVPDVQTISSVTVESGNEGKLRLRVLTADGSVDRMRSSIRAVIQSELTPMLYVATWEYTIVSGTSSSVDVKSTDSRMPSLSKVPMVPGLMGEVVTPTPGSKCRVRFLNADPSRPECIGIIGSPVKVEICEPIPTQASARFGDPVSPAAIIGGSLKVFIGG